jgi:hypothetical protein
MRAWGVAQPRLDVTKLLIIVEELEYDRARAVIMRLLSGSVLRLLCMLLQLRRRRRWQRLLRRRRIKYIAASLHHFSSSLMELLFILALLRLLDWVEVQVRTQIIVARRLSWSRG